MNLILMCSFEQFCGINMMGGSVKSDEGILKIYFCAMAALFHSTRGGENFQIDLTHSPIHNIISRRLILDYWRWSHPDKASLALGADTPPGYPLPVEECNHIDHVPFVSPLHKLLELVHYCTSVV